MTNSKLMLIADLGQMLDRIHIFAINPLTPTVKPWVIQSFLTLLTFDSIYEQYFTVLLFVFQFHAVGNFGTFINFGFGTVKSEMVNDTR